MPLFDAPPPYSAARLLEDHRRPNSDYTPAPRGMIVGHSLVRTKRGIAIDQFIAQGGNRPARRRRLSVQEVSRLLDS